ncbi:hypothetical protein F5Y12DRAFT_718560 [Xylaria sp. FL1777]|nr:hypothetical protein F5Y12DRAFT_718560 [Xylaria sp. FL1777]
MMDLVQSRQPFSLSDDSDEEVDTPRAIEAAIDADTGPRAQRERVNYILKLILQKATMYDLLGVPPYATPNDILIAWKRIVGGVHPDKNKDKGAKKCTQHVNNARDVLIDPKKRMIYDNFLNSTPRPPMAETFGEDFAEGAFDDAGSDDDNAFELDDEDSEEDIEATYLPPSTQVVKLHRKITPFIREFFESLEGPINLSRLVEIDKINKKIERENLNRKRPVPTMYGVPRQKLLGIQYTQRSILMKFQIQILDTAEVKREILGLQTYFTKTCQRPLYSWPMDWVQLLMEPLLSKLAMQGIHMEQQMPPQIGNGTSLPNVNTDDVKMEEDTYEDVDEDIEGAHRQNTRRRLRPGFTVNGDPILGYFPTSRRAIEGSTVTLGFTMFVRVDGVNPIKIALGSEVGDAAALAYHQLPQHKKNNIQESAAKYATMSPTEFVEIIGVAYMSGGCPGRLPTTYIWVETRTHSAKPTIVTRSTLRRWLQQRVADQYIDDWFAAKGITPEWKVLDPASDSRNLRLAYPPAGRSGNSRSRTQTSKSQLTSSREESQVEELSKKFDRIVDMLAKGQEEAREDRRLQWEMMNRLFSGSHPQA